MKKIIFVTVFITMVAVLKAQEFNAQLTTAKTAYASGKLDDSRFAMQQMLQEIDIILGKEVIKLLPAKLEDKTANVARDKVTGTSGWVGVMIHRDYGADDKNVNLEIISNSPMLAGINALLSLPLVGNSGDSKVIRIAGYKALVQKNGEADKPEFTVQVPMNSSLLTLTAPVGYTQDQVIKMANAIPVDKIAKMLQ
jgi:hypothetical protein